MSNESVRDHKDLDVWEQSVDSVDEVYRITKMFPADQLYGSVNQMQTPVMSIPVNIAEGAARASGKEFSQVPIHSARSCIKALNTDYHLKVVGIY
jgi:four helix bundle protein